MTLWPADDTRTFISAPQGACLANSQCAGSAEAIPLWALWQLQDGLLSQMMNGSWQASDEDSSDKTGIRQVWSPSDSLGEKQRYCRCSIPCSLEFSPGYTPRLSHPGHHRPKDTVGSCASVVTLKGTSSSLLECLECQANLSSISFRGPAHPLCLYYGSRFAS